MKALFRLIDVYGEPIRLRITPQPQSPEEKQKAEALCGTRGCFDFEMHPNSLLVLNADMGDALMRLFAERLK